MNNDNPAPPRDLLAEREEDVREKDQESTIEFVHTTLTGVIISKTH